MATHREDPINPLMQEYIVGILSSLSDEQYRLLNDNEKLAVYKKGRILKFLKTSRLYTILSLLTKVGMEWGFYIIDKDFDLGKMEDIAKNSEKSNKIFEINKLMKRSRSFITNSKKFAELQSLIISASHGKETQWDRRFIEVSRRITKKLNVELDNYDILTDAKEFKATYDGYEICIDFFKNLPKLNSILSQYGLRISDFVILSQFAKEPDNFFEIKDLTSIVGNVKTHIKRLKTSDFISGEKSMQINTKGTVFYAKVIGQYLYNIDL